jgi:hypothetical protein
MDDDDSSENTLSPSHPSSESALHVTATMEDTACSPPVVTRADIGEAGLATPQSSYVASIMNIPGTDAAFQFSTPTFTNCTSTDSFPDFHAGNVIIRCNLVTPPKHWQLHSAILARHSSWFRQAMQLFAQKSECFQNWVFFLLEEHDGKVALVLQEAIPRSQAFAIKHEASDITLTATSTPPPSELPVTETLSPATAVNQAHSATVDLYDQIFGSFYSVPLKIPNTTFSDTLTTCESLVKITDNLSCTHLISTPITSALLSHHRTFFTHISRDPARYLLLAILLQNTCIYTESLIHIIGAHPSWPWPTSRTLLPPNIMDLVVRKSEDLDRLCTDTERDLLLLTIETHRSVPVQPHNHAEFETWFIVQLYRDTLSTTFRTLENARDRTLKRGALYRKIRKGGVEYMPVEEMRSLVQRAMPSAVGNLEEDLGLLKGCARGIVEDVARNEALVDVEREGVGWLTCVKIERKDVPWENEREREE